MKNPILDDLNLEEGIDPKSLCEEYSEGYSPLTECRGCAIQLSCLVAYSKQSKKKVAKFKKKQGIKYFLDEYLAIIREGVQLPKIQDIFIEAIKESEREVSFREVLAMLEDPEGEAYYRKLFRTEDDRFPLVFFYSLETRSAGRIAIDKENMTAIWK